VVAIVGLLAAIAIPTYENVLFKSRRAALIADSYELYNALLRYNVDQDQFPPMFSPPAQSLNTTTLEPLASAGYFTNVQGLMNKLHDSRVLVYVAPFPNNDRFWLALQMKDEPRNYVIVAHSDQFPSSVGNWYDGVFWYDHGKMTPVSQL